jgi:ankyrin repeat protein
VVEELRLASMDNRFSVIALCTAIAYAYSIEPIKLYAQEYKDDDDEFKEMMRVATSVLYYAIGMNDPDIVNLLLEYGAGPNGTSDDENFIPPLAFTVVQGHLESLETTEIVENLLGAGIDPEAQPRDMWKTT